MSWVRLYLAWVNKQPRELRLMLKSGVWLVVSIAVAILIVPLLAGFAAALTGGMFGFFFAWSATLLLAFKVGIPVLVLVIGLPWLFLLLPTLIIGVSLGPLGLLNWVMQRVFPVMATVKDWSAFKSHFTRMLESDPAKEAERVEQGSARFASPEEVTALKSGAIALGQIDGKPFTGDTPKHVLVLASSRSGKVEAC